MQLVTDKVVMFDTMKDRRIGIPEVIEKFGVPPEKVVEVQALAAIPPTMFRVCLASASRPPRN